MSAKDKELEIEDDLARGMSVVYAQCRWSLIIASPEDTARAKSQDLVTVEEELRTRERCPLPRLPDSIAYSEPHGIGRGRQC